MLENAMNKKLTKAEKQEKIKHFLALYYSNIDLFKLNNLPSWVNFYAYMLQKEIDGKVPRYFKIYSKGEVVLANFGTSIGKELCGMHFAIVLNKKDNKYNTLLTVIPLSSKNHNKYVSLGNELSDQMLNAGIESQKKLEQQTEAETKKFVNFFEYIDFNNLELNEKEIQFIKSEPSISPLSQEDYISNAQSAQESYKKLISKFNTIKNNCEYPVINKYILAYDFIEESIKKFNKINKSINKIKRFWEETQRHDKLSFAVVDNIKTISKLRLQDFYDRSLVKKIIISNDSLEKIQNKLDELI